MRHDPGDSELARVEPGDDRQEIQSGSETRSEETRREIRKQDEQKADKSSDNGKKDDGEGKKRSRWPLIILAVVVVLAVIGGVTYWLADARPRKHRRRLY